MCTWNNWCFVFVVLLMLFVPERWALHLYLKVQTNTPLCVVGKPKAKCNFVVIMYTQINKFLRRAMRRTHLVMIKGFGPHDICV